LIGRLHSRHRAIEFKKFLQTIGSETPEHLGVDLVLDNASTHKAPGIKRWLLAHPRFQLHFAPTSSSWLNLVERRFSELTTKNCGAAPTDQSASSTPTSAPGSIRGTKTPSRLCRPRPPSRSSTRSLPTAGESMNQDTRLPSLGNARRPDGCDDLPSLPSQGMAPVTDTFPADSSLHHLEIRLQAIQPSLCHARPAAPHVWYLNAIVAYHSKLWSPLPLRFG
jgi:DDE superfamily endonuclease